MNKENKKLIEVENTNVYEETDEEDIQMMQEYFDEKVWKNMKKDVKEMTRRESCFFAFLTGAEIIRKSIGEGLEKELEKEFDRVIDKLKGMSEEEIKKMLEEEEKKENLKVKDEGIDDDFDEGEGNEKKENVKINDEVGG